MSWHVYDIRFAGYEPLTGRDYSLARFDVTRDQGDRMWQVEVRARPSLREALGEKVRGYSDRDLVAGLGAQAIIIMLQDGIEPFEQLISLDAAHYPGRPGEPAIVPDYEHITLRVETTPAGEVVPPQTAQGPYEAGHPHRMS